MSDINCAIESLKLHKTFSISDLAPLSDEDIDMAITALEKQINGGWIPCSERLPEDLNDKNIDCFLVTDGFLIWMAYYNSEIGWQFAECTNSRNKIDWTEIIAWQPLPQPYTENRKES